MCGGAMDGKHIKIKCPPHSGSEFFNYKGDYSIVLLALVDSDYCFTYVDIGKAGRCSDGGVFSSSTLKVALDNNTLNMPDELVFVADAAFPLTHQIMKPFTRHGELSHKERIFNYRLSRARRIVEDTFGIINSKFRVLQTAIPLKITTTDEVIKAICCLHNWLRKTGGSRYMTSSLVDHEDTEEGKIVLGSWRLDAPEGTLDVRRSGVSNNYTKSASRIREDYANYFVGPGAVPWQDKMIEK